MEAINLVRPTVEKILNDKKMTWGPKWIEGFIKAPGLKYGITDFTIGKKTEWNLEWGEKVSFSEIAAAKMHVIEREGINSSQVVATKPWKLETGEFLYPGGACRDGICVAVSGARGRADEAIAEMIISAIVMLAFMEADQRLKEGKYQI